MRKPILHTLIVVALLACTAAAQFSTIGPEPGKASASIAPERLSLGNDVIGADWAIADHKLAGVRFSNRLERANLSDSEAFVITLKDGTEIKSSDLRIVGT